MSRSRRSRTELAATNSVELRARGQASSRRTRLEERTRYDLETLREVGYCSGIENYSRHLQAPRPAPRRGRCSTTSRTTGCSSSTSRTCPCRRSGACTSGDISAQGDAGRLRLPPPLGARQSPAQLRGVRGPHQPGRLRLRDPRPYEHASARAGRRAVIRPTGLPDPERRGPPHARADRRPARRGARRASERGERTLVTTLTKKMAEDLTDYLQEMGVKRACTCTPRSTPWSASTSCATCGPASYDVLVGINLLREGLDLPEVSLVCILDADKEGYLRSGGSLIQTMGRAARHARGPRDHVRRRQITDRCAPPSTRPIGGGITAAAPTTSSTASACLGIEQADPRHHPTRPAQVAEESPAPYAPAAAAGPPAAPDELVRLVKELESQMKQAPASWSSSAPRCCATRIVELRRELVGGESTEGLRSPCESETRHARSSARWRRRPHPARSSAPAVGAASASRSGTGDDVAKVGLPVDIDGVSHRPRATQHRVSSARRARGRYPAIRVSSSPNTVADWGRAMGESLYPQRSSSALRDAAGRSLTNPVNAHCPEALRFPADYSFGSR